MTNTNDTFPRPREVERDARALAKFSGMKYTRALRLIEHPLAQGILGERVCARDVIRVLTEHAVLSRPGADSNNRSTHLGSNGLWSAGEYPLEVSTEDDYLSVVLTAEVLRMFDRTAVSNSDASSYGLKHTAQEFLGQYLQSFSYITNGTAFGPQQCSIFRLRQTMRKIRAQTLTLGWSPSRSITRAACAGVQGLSVNGCARTTTVRRGTRTCAAF